MRNLRNLESTVWVNPHAVPISAACWDPGVHGILCTVGPNEENEVVLLRIRKRSEHEVEVARWRLSSDTPCGKILDLHCMGDISTSCLVLEGGDIYTVLETDTGSSIEIVGTIDAGIGSAKWSPDGELLAIVTKANTVLLMSRSFDPIADVTMTPEDLKASKHVSVGWGHKETQFKGPGARALRDPTIPEKVDQGTLSADDDGRTTISWRGDGGYVAVNSIEAGKRRVIRVYTREGILDGVSEPVDGMHGHLSWRPAGNLIAAVQQLPTETNVVFFERNGLRHGQFTLRSPHTWEASKALCPRLEWNVDSTVLAVVYPETVQLWTMGNYHWYLKQEIFVYSSTVFSWHPEKSLCFLVAGEDRTSWFEYSFAVARGSTCLGTDHGAVAVIDGTTLKLTPFKAATIPPPMSLYDIEVEGPIVDVAFTHGNEYLLIIHATGIDIYRWIVKGKRSEMPELVVRSPLSDLIEVSGGTQPVSIAAGGASGSIVRFLMSVLGKSGRVILVSVGLELDSKRLKNTFEHEIPGPMLLVNGEQVLALGDKKETPLTISNTGNLEQLAAITVPPNVVCWAETQMLGERLVLVSLTKGGLLYADDQLLASNCTSFCLTNSHIILTTSNHLVKFVHLAPSLQDDALFQLPSDDPENDERCRSVERGARLVTAVPSSMSIVLQMPRGNLETIFPRAMVLAGIRQAIGQKDYKSAYAYCRSHRVDLNILHDHDPGQFLDNVGLFLDQLASQTSVDLFLSCLSEEDVSQTMYKDTAPTARHHHNTTRSPSNNKVNIICDAVLKALVSRSSASPQNIITAHVSRVPPAIDEGLLVITNLQKQSYEQAEKAAEHICFLVDVSKLYDHALGLYDLELAMLIAQQAQRDPREYVPFIQSLHAQPELRRRYTIDDHLGRRELALSHLHELGDYDEFRRYTLRHSLYTSALRLCSRNEARRQEIMQLLAQYLEAASKFHDAGLAYDSLGDYVRATACYRAAGPTSWRECLAAAYQQNSPPLDDSALVDLITALADALAEAKNHTAAAELYADHLNTPEQAVRSYCRAYLFSQARQLCVGHRLRTTSVSPQQQHSAEHLMSIFDQGLIDASGASTEFLAECRGQLGAQVTRVLELRERAQADPLAFYEGETAHGGGGGGNGIPDDVSVAASSTAQSTRASLFTRYTGRSKSSVGTAATGVSRATAKNRKREEKKRARGRKGTVYEEEYLVNSLRRLVERVEGTAKPEIRRLVEALVQRGMHDRATAVETLLAEVVAKCEAAVGQVWDQAEQTTDGNKGASEEEWAPTGGDAVLAEMLEEKMRKQTPPMIKKFEGLSLLG